MIKKYICLSVVVMLSMIATNVPQAMEIKEVYKLTPEDAQIQNDIDGYYFIDKTDIEIKGDFELLSSWLQPGNTILASNGYIFYWIDIHDAKFYDKFIWDYFIPILSPETGIPTGEYDTLFMYYNSHFPPSLTYMPPDFSNSNPYYWQPYWTFSYIFYEEDIFNPDSCWSYAVGFSFSDNYFLDKDPGVWRTEVNMTTETNTIPTLLCDTIFNVIDDIPPTAYISYIKDCGYVGDTCTIKAGGADNAFVVKTELFIDDILVNTVAGSPMEYLWTVPQDEEIHVVQAKTYDVNNPPLYLGLCTTSGPVRVSRTNIQATQIVASNNVKLYQYQNDTIFQGHFASLYDFVVDKQIPVGAIINADKYLLFQLNLKLECFNFGQPTTWRPVCKYNIDLSEFGGTEAKGEFTGWNGSILVNKEVKNISEKSFGEHDLLLELKFEDQNGNLISGANIPMKCWVFFHRESKWKKEKKTAIAYGPTYPWGDAEAVWTVTETDGVNVPNWYYFGKRLECFADVAQIQSSKSNYTINTPFSAFGFYIPWYNADIYYITNSAGYSIDVKDTSGVNLYTLYGIDALAFVCRHENTHRNLFLQWWGSWGNYFIKWQTDDPDKDFVPTNTELVLGLDPNNRNSRPPASYISNYTDFEYIVYTQHSVWARGIWNLYDWAFPGKQTDPKY